MGRTSPIKIIADGTALTAEPCGARERFLSLYGAAAKRPGCSLIALVGKGSGLEEPLEAASVRVRHAEPASFRAARLFSSFNPAARIAAEESAAPSSEGAACFAAGTLPLPRLPGLPKVATIHDLRFLHLGYSSLGKRLFSILFLGRNLKRAHAVVTVSRAMANELRSSGLVAADKIFVVPNAAPPPAGVTPERAAAIRRELGLSGPYFLFIGRAEPRKNVSLLLNAFEDLIRRDEKGFRLVLAGSLTGRLGRGALKKIGSSRLLRERVVVTGIVSQECKAALFQGARLFVQPSLYEGFGLGLLEAMSQGVSVVCSSIPAHREVAGRAALFFDPHSAADLAAALSKAASENRLRNELSAAGLEESGRYSWDRSASLFEEACREGGRNR